MWRCFFIKKQGKKQSHLHWMDKCQTISSNTIRNNWILTICFYYQLFWNILEPLSIMNLVIITYPKFMLKLVSHNITSLYHDGSWFCGSNILYHFSGFHSPSLHSPVALNIKKAPWINPIFMALTNRGSDFKSTVAVSSWRMRRVANCFWCPPEPLNFCSSESCCLSRNLITNKT